LRRRLRIPALALGLLLAAGAGRAEDAAPARDAAPAATEAPAAQPEPAPIQPVPLPRVAEESEAVVQSARKLGALGVAVPEIEEIETSLPEQTALLDERAKRAKSLAADPTSLVALEEELKSFELAREQLANSLTLLTSRLTDLDAALEDLTRQRQVWKATEQQALEAVAPDTVVARIRDVSQALRDAKRNVEKRRDELLALQSRVAEEEKRAREALDTLVAARDSFRSLLFLRDQPPLWQAARPEQLELTTDLSETLGVRWRALKRFVERRKERLGTHLAILAVALVATLALRRRAAAWRQDDPRLEASAVIFERPISAALLVVVALTPLLHPRAPRLAQAITVALLAAPIVRLLPRLLEPALAPAVYALAGFALVDSVRDVIAKAVFFERTLLLIETLGALAFLLWMLRPARLAELPQGTRLARWPGRLLRLAALLLALSAIANLAGWLHLGRSLADGVLGAAYAGVVLYGGARVLRTVARAALRSDTARRLGVVRRRGPEVAIWARRVIHVAAGLSWVYFGLASFGLEDWSAERLRALLGAEASFGTIAISFGDVLAFVATIVGAVALSRLLRTILEDDVLPRLPTARGVPHAVTSTVHYVLLLLGFLLAISAAGVDLNRVSLLAGALGVGIGFGLQNVVNNFVSGLILLYERPVQIGDMVEVGGLTGEVKRIGIRSSTIRTFHGAEVIVPNANLISDQVVNWTFSDRRRRMDVKVGVAYGTDPERVLTLLVGVANAHPDVLEEPRPQALFMGFGDSSLDFELRAWTGRFENWVMTQSQLTVGVNRALAEAGLEIPFPQRDLHLRSADEKAARALRGATD
jgi:potassium-dependent mechanosensitive channel